MRSRWCGTVGLPHRLRWGGHSRRQRSSSGRAHRCRSLALRREQARLPSTKDWFIRALHPVDGEMFTATTPARPGLVLGFPLGGVRELQNRLRKQSIRPHRLEVGTAS